LPRAVAVPAIGGAFSCPRKATTILRARGASPSSLWGRGIYGGWSSTVLYRRRDSRRGGLCRGSRVVAAVRQLSLSRLCQTYRYSKLHAWVSPNLGRRALSARSVALFISMDAQTKPVVKPITPQCQRCGGHSALCSDYPRLPYRPQRSRVPSERIWDDLRPNIS
jgi:hypothetical protein